MKRKKVERLSSYRMKSPVWLVPISIDIER